MGAVGFGVCSVGSFMLWAGMNGLVLGGLPGACPDSLVVGGVVRSRGRTAPLRR